MNISEIKQKPCWSTSGFKDYRVSMAKMIEERWIKNWINNLQTDEFLREELLKEGVATVRVRHNSDGEIYEMMASSDARSRMCCMFYRGDSMLPVLEIINFGGALYGVDGVEAG